jgi:AraC family transcriptional regulator of adaptative response/methylated-DNA-[protein]-cysteine methyltransferase
MNREHEVIRYAEGRTPLGKVLAATTSRGLCALRLLEGRSSAALLREIRADFPHAEFVQDNTALQPLLEQVNEVLEGRLAASKIKLDMPGTPFQKEVWQELLRVRRGQVCSYSELARRVGRPKAVRAVASACARNPVAFIVPCHRVLRKGGGLGGYGYGLDCKREILRMENVEV